MASVEFDEQHPKSKEELFAALFEDENDPRSRLYKRVLIRPRIRWGRVLLAILLPAFFLSALGVLLVKLHIGRGWILGSILLLALLYLALTAKRGVICLIRIYQRYAPASVRNKCRFEPSCSQYMVLSIRKYGLVKGLSKGIGRLKRCNINGGGFDFP